MMKSSVGVARVGVLLIFLLTLSFTLVACEPLITIRIHNQTDETLQIFTGTTFIGEAVPEGEVTWKIERIYPSYTVIAKDMDGKLVYSVNFTKEDFKGKHTYDVYFPPTGKDMESSDNITEK